MSNAANTTGPVSVKAYTDNHRHLEMLTADGTVVVHRWQHVVSGHHYVTEYTAENQFPGVKHVQHGTELDAKRAWVKLYRKYN